jgi:hypothetical protein
MNQSKAIQKVPAFVSENQGYITDSNNGNGTHSFRLG